MKWFKHFTNASTNNKLSKLRMRYGADGYAIYWYCLELIAGNLGESDEINFDLKHDAEVIGFNLKVDQIRVEEIMNYMVSVDLFNESDGVISCIKLAKYLDKKNTRNAYIHEIIDKTKELERIEGVADKSGHVADKSGQNATNPARLDKNRLDKNRKDIKEKNIKKENQKKTEKPETVEPHQRISSNPHYLQDITEQTYLDFKELRKAKKSPITERAIQGIRNEAEKAGMTLENALIECCLRGWAGFKAEWITQGSQNNRLRLVQSQDRTEYNKQQTEIARKRLFGDLTGERIEKDITP
jgi:hypothetical protein